MGFSRKTAILVFVVGAIMVGAFALHRLQTPARKICQYNNWAGAGPCHTSGFHADWVNIGALIGVAGLALAAGAAVGSLKRRGSAARSSAQGSRA